jgi:lysine decarboxylase
MITAGDRAFEIERLISHYRKLSASMEKDKVGLLTHEYIDPEVAYNPSEGLYSDKKSLPLKECVGHISGEFVMCYPPGIPILAPGERITDEIIDYIMYAKEKGSVMTGPKDMKVEHINVVESD